MMTGFIFAAGLGTRLKPLTDRIPKALVPLAGKPLLQWQVEKLRDAGITDIVVNVHHFPDMIIDAIRTNDGWGCSISVSDERETLLDTGGGLYKAWKDGLLAPDKPVLACNVDILSNIHIPALVASHDAQTLGTLVVSERQTQRYLLFDALDTLCGWTNVATGEFRPEGLSGVAEATRLAFSGMQVLEPAVRTHMQRLAETKGDKFSLIDLYLDICGRNSRPVNARHSVLKAFVPEKYKMMDVGKIDRIAEAEAFAQSLLKD